MPIDQQLLGQKLRRYRTQFDRTLTEVSGATGIGEHNLEAYEAGSLTPSGDEILIFADYYKCDYKFFISNEKLAPFEETETMFRRYGIEFSREDRWSVQEFLFLCECESFLQAELGKRQKKQFVFRAHSSSFKKQGDETAAELRRHLDYPEIGIPLDIYKDFRSIGIHVFRRKLRNSNISGLYLKHPVAGNCILINFSEDVYRQRFTAAHEACHAILDSDASFIVSFASEGQEEHEKRANRFASHYLAPTNFLRAIPQPTNWDTVKGIEWANKLKISTEALAYALRRAGLIDPDTVEIIKSVRVPKKDKTDPEIPADLSPKSRTRKLELLEKGLSNDYVSLCFEGYREGKVSASRLGEMLLMESDSELQVLATLYREQLQYGA